MNKAVNPGRAKKKAVATDSLIWNKILAATYFPTFWAVSSALVGLTSLFGMGRGDHHRYSRHNIVNILVPDNARGRETQSIFKLKLLYDKVSGY